LKRFFDLNTKKEGVHETPVMQRRKLLVGLGALGAGGIGAFGTEAFTSVEANRNVDVAVAGDASAYLAVQPTGSANADDYVQTESDDTVSIELDGDGGASGAGVNQDAVTEIDELLSLVNQGTQEVAVYVDEDSPAVTFRADGSSIEGPSSAVSLGVGESVTVGITVDTLNNDVSGSLIDAVTLVATTEAGGTGVSAPSSFDATVAPDGSGDYTSLAEAFGANGVSEGATVGVGADLTVGDSRIDIDTPGVTLASTEGRRTIRNETLSGNADGAVLRVSASDVTIQSLEVVTAASVTSNNTAPREIDVVSGGDGATIADNTVRRPDETGGTDVDGTPEIAVRQGVSDATVSGNMLDGGPIGLNDATGSVVGNTVQNVATEGVFAFGYSDAPALTVRNNVVDDHDTEDAGNREIKLSVDPASVNGESGRDAQFRSLLTENEVNTVRIDGSDGLTVDAGGTGNLLTDLSTAVSEAGADGYVRVREGSYGAFSASSPGITVESVEGARPTVSATSPGEGNIVDVEADATTVRGLEVVGDNAESLVGVAAVSGASDIVVEDVRVRQVLTGVQFSSGSSDNTARFVTVEDAQVGVSPAGGTGHLVERCEFTGLVSGSYANAPEGVGAAGAGTSRNNNYGEDVFLRSYSSEPFVSDGDFFGTNGEDGEVVANDGTLDDENLTVQNVVTTANDAGVR